MTLNELLDRMTSNEIYEWMAYDNITHSDSWVQSGQISAILANAFSSRRKVFKPSDFMPSKRSYRDPLAGALPADGLQAAMAKYRVAQNKETPSQP